MQLETAELERYLSACCRPACAKKYDARTSPCVFYCSAECEAAHFGEKKLAAAQAFAELAGRDFDVAKFGLKP